MAAAEIGAADRVLDVGCGNGETAIDVARLASEGSSVGVDLAAPLLRVAEARAVDAGVENVSFLQADAQVHPFEPGSYDVVVSRFGTTFFSDPAAAFGNLSTALRPGGRLAVVSWRSLAENEWIRSFAQALQPTGTPGDDPSDAPAGPPPGPPPEGPGPFAHARQDRVREILSDTGFTDIEFEPIDPLMYFGRDADEAYTILRPMLGWMTGDVDDASREAALERLLVSLRSHETPEGVAYGSAGWLFAARRRNG
jgi:SAM-dependent methyltransferase